MRPRRAGRALATLAALAGAAGAARAQDAATPLVLALPASARAMALGGTAALLGDGDAAALLYNPALAATPRGGAELSLQRLPGTATLAAIAVAQPLARGRLSVALQLLTAPPDDEIVPDVSDPTQGVPTGGTVQFSELSGTAGYARAVGPLSLGVAARVTRQVVGYADASVASADAGAAAELPLPASFPRATVSAAVQHAGRRIDVEGDAAPLERLARGGVALRWPAWRGVGVSAAGELVASRTGTRALAGVEVELRTASAGPAAVARAGYGRPSPGSVASPLTLGAGVVRGALSLDYAYQGYGEVGGGAHRVGARWRP